MNYRKFFILPISQQHTPEDEQSTTLTHGKRSSEYGMPVLFVLTILAVVALLMQVIPSAEAGNSEARKQMEAQSKAIASGVKANAHVGEQTAEVKRQLEASKQQQSITDAECKRKFGPEFQAGVGKRLCINHINGETRSWNSGNKPTYNPNTGNKGTSAGNTPTYGCISVQDCINKGDPSKTKTTKGNNIGLKGKAWEQLKGIGRSGGWGGN
ncbi:MAG: hypothetical protein QXN55_03740 [Candidatus Nitrosotenuis sp.]